MKLRPHVIHAALGALVLGLGACASAPVPRSVTLTYESSPAGATLYEGGKSIGVAPVTRSYVVEPGVISFRTPEVIAQWPSGAKEGFFTFLKPGDDRVATIERPANAPGAQADIDNGKKVVAAREAEERRNKEALRRDQARSSERCKRQMAGTSLAVQDDCAAP